MGYWQMLESSRSPLCGTFHHHFLNYLLFGLWSALTGGQDTAFAEFFGKGVSATQYRTVTNKFYELQGVKKYANTKEERPITFTFSCYDLYNGCGNNVGAYVKVPEANLVTFCPLFFSPSRMIALSYMCSSQYFRPDNDGVYYRGAYMSRCSDYDASDTIWHMMQEPPFFMNSCISNSSWIRSLSLVCLV